MPVPFGINLNSDPQAVLGRPANASELNGVKYARFVFFLHDTVKNGQNPFGYDLANPLDYGAALTRAFAFYDPLIASYPRVLLVLNHQSFAGNAPWFPGSDGNWDVFATNFARFCGQIAAHYTGKNVVYEIWNEGDQAPIPGEDPSKRASVFVRPQDFAPILDRAVTEIRSHDPDSPIVLGGLVTGATGAIQYLKQMQAALQAAHRPFPTQDIGFHPYGAYPGQHAPAIPGGWFGRLAEDGLNPLIQAFPDFRFWITEVGVSEDNPLPQEDWPAIAAYMQGVYDLVQDSYSSVVKALVWFAWSDKMRNAGIIDGNGNRKQPIYNQFFHIATMPDAAPPANVAVTDHPLFVTPTTGLNVRPDASASNPPLAQVAPGDKLLVIEPDRLAALAKLGQMGAWLHIRTPGGVEGFSAAWFLSEYTDPPVSVPADRAAGEQRALDFQHQPSLVNLPLLVSPKDIHRFNGFGPNNFAYYQFTAENGSIYKNLFGLHNGVDFMVPLGTPLCAVDWGLVVQVSSQDGDAPLGAKPRTVTVLYGNMLTLYGHMSDTSAVHVGDIVAPRDRIGLSGKDPTDGDHLHFEMRELRPNFLQNFKAQIQAKGLAATMQQWFSVGQARGNVRVFTNPAPFFTTRLETYGWGSACPMPDVDKDGNGYPDRILRPGEAQPTAFDLYWMPSFYPPSTGSFWDGSHVV